METRAQQRNWGMSAQQAQVQPIAPAPPAFALGPGRGDTLLDYGILHTPRPITRPSLCWRPNMMVNHQAYMCL